MNGAARADASLAEQLHAGLDHRVVGDFHVGIDQDVSGQIDRDACIHQRRRLARAKHAIDFGQLRARVAAEGLPLASTGLDGENAFALLIEHGNRVGEIKLAMRIVRAQLGKAGPKFLERRSSKYWN